MVKFCRLYLQMGLSRKYVFFLVPTYGTLRMTEIENEGEHYVHVRFELRVTKLLLRPHLQCGSSVLRTGRPRAHALC